MPEQRNCIARVCAVGLLALTPMVDGKIAQAQQPLLATDQVATRMGLTSSGIASGQSLTLAPLKSQAATHGGGATTLRLVLRPIDLVAGEHLAIVAKLVHDRPSVQSFSLADLQSNGLIAYFFQPPKPGVDAEIFLSPDPWTGAEPPNAIMVGVLQGQADRQAASSFRVLSAELLR